MSTNLEERQEEIQLLLRGPTVKTVPARIQKRANQADAEEIVRQVQHVNLPGDWGAAFYKPLALQCTLAGRLTMAKCNDPVQGIEYDR